MRQIVIGMDGAQMSTFERGWTPWLQSLIEKKGIVLHLKEDLISRGWAEIITGEHAIVTGAMYERPLMNGRHDWTDKLSLADMKQMNGGIQPVWQVLNDRGDRVGIMNVPTTFPAPRMDGFFVSGGGGGGPLSQQVSAEQCFPGGIANQLNDLGYILDERLPSLLEEKQLFAPEDFFGRLDKMNEKRTTAFLNLAKQHAIDFGFIVYKSSIVTTETLLLPELARLDAGRAVNSDFIAAAKCFYGAFDEHIKRLVETFSDAEILLVSDHAMALRRWSVNPNVFLVEHGFQKQSNSRRRIYEIVKSYRHLVPRFIRQALKSSKRIKSTYQSMITFDAKASEAFNITYTNALHGIYVNDAQRFGGPVLEDRVEDVKARIVEALNTHPKSVEHGLTARKKKPADSIPARQFPDVIIDMPDGYAPSNEWPDFIKAYIAGDDPIDLREMQRDRRVSVKAHHPLAVSVNGPWRVTPSEDKPDLRLVYDQILATRDP